MMGALSRRLSLLLLTGLSAWLASCAQIPKISPRPVLGDGKWTSYDGKVMPYTVWKPATDVPLRGIIIAVHGLSGAASDFWLLGERMPPQGYAVYAYELRGQGNDPVEGDRGDIRSANQWMNDLETFHWLVRRRHPGVPVFWYGESLGSLICLHTAAEHMMFRPGPRGMVLASPVAGLRMTVSDFRRWMLKTAAAIAPRQRYSLGELAGIDERKIQVTSHGNHADQMAHTPHHVSSFTLRLLAEIGRMLDRNPNAARGIETPTLFLASPNDVLSSPDQVQTLFQQLDTKKKTLLWYSRSYHLLLHDVQHDDVVEDLSNWLNQQTR